MQAMIPFPDISPEIFTLPLFGMEFALRWYALAYIVGILVAWRISLAALRRPALWRAQTPPMTARQLEDLLTWVVLGIILGGRLGFVMFYQPGYYLQNPLEILRIWQGGMSFHGGFLGVVIATLVYCARHRIPLLSAGDTIVLGAPVGLLLGRIANFINAELWGRPTDLPWGVAFPGAAAQACGQPLGEICARHPSQLYEAALEGALLLAVLLWLAFRRGALHVPGRIFGVFLAGYGAARVVVEHFRQADAQFITPDNPLGHVLRLGDWGLSMGQLLSLPMLLAGLALIVAANRLARA
ncbi:MAG: prolipoprotein diacylglyceryl transferase [Sediminimonas qiaohouensis]|uniref:Phosphatidylglycerol--prolipoprotein diacylglyceryl transferase n=1 Tax=Sediminimonas qiaohouensis TaxID=552061 RepID=A0A7C9L6V5_9RHOB|nr:prolipoprotein diacylglyceryl transferase [Sediminimonas qiaohouensis]MTJ03174.1 prolipoprotein diacylglyceryl transferase [Sediminimonas qiaohouensis]